MNQFKSFNNLSSDLFNWVGDAFQIWPKFSLFLLKCWLFMIAKRETDFSSEFLFAIRLQYHKSAASNNRWISSSFLTPCHQTCSIEWVMLFKSAQSFLCFRLMLTSYDRKERNGFLLQVFICHQITISQISRLKQSTNQFNFFYNLSSGLFNRVGDVYKFAVTKFDRFKLVSEQGDFTFVIDGRTF
jgi:hypothetical protein